MGIKKLILQMVFIVAICMVIAIGWNFSLIKRYIAGEFEQSFLSQVDYPNITFITIAEAEDLFISGEAIFIDSRTQEKFQAGRILGALNMPYEAEVKGDIEGILALPLDRILVIYCDGDECQSSVQLAKALHDQGFLDLKVFFGGWEEWLGEGLPIEND